MNRFEGKSALVTGGSSGIGLAAARAFATEGARVVITGRDATALEAAKVLLGGNALALRRCELSYAPNWPKRPLLKSSMACAISGSVFMTKGP